MDATIKIGTMKVDDSFEIINQLRKSLVEKVGQIKSQSRLIELIEEKINYLFYHRFGLNSERFGERQQLLFETASILEQSLGGCPRVENLLRKIPFGKFSRSFSLKSYHYSPHMIEKSDSKWLSRATAPILGQPARDFLDSIGNRLHLIYTTI